MENIGLDLHQRESQLCMLADTGEVLERRIRTTPERLTAVLGPGMKRLDLRATW